MLKNKHDKRSISDNIKLGSLTAFSAGMVNVTSVVIFFSFTSNVTGHYAILAHELSKGNWYQAAIVLAWIFLFFFGNFISNILIINMQGSRKYLGHALPLILEIICLLMVGTYLEYQYAETLQETEALVALMLFAMGLQNGLTASISNSAVKTTHLTGLTTDLGILFSLFTKKIHREDKELTNKAQLLLAILFSYLIGGIFAGLVFLEIQNTVFYIVSAVLGIILIYDYHAIRFPGVLIVEHLYLRRRSKKVEGVQENIDDRRKSA
ncbi:YoaK family protein [Reichenbachiella sp. MALMAid0571]|uniref:YoaK family protein n=1 Tax=Reichenbachiella sp. MALMAid0571 TaxID=3143939 RepID=UPI0032DFA634